jgi:MFS transporter, DHA1 family, inner membrane transport protein
MPSLIAMLFLQGVVLALIYVVSPYPLPMITALTIWSALNFVMGTPIQTRILTWTADAPNLAASLIPSGFNVGIAIAASFGAMILASGFSYRILPLVGVAAMAVGTAVALGSYLSELHSGAVRPLAAGTADQP